MTSSRPESLPASWPSASPFTAASGPAAPALRPAAPRCRASPGPPLRPPPPSPTSTSCPPISNRTFTIGTPAAQAAYLSLDNTGSTNDKFISYDDEHACQAKVSYARNRGLGGVMIWELGQGYRPTPAQPASATRCSRRSNKRSSPHPTLRPSCAPTGTSNLTSSACRSACIASSGRRNLTSGSWSILTNNVPGTGGVLQVTDPGALDARTDAVLPGPDASLSGSGHESGRRARTGTSAAARYRISEHGHFRQFSPALASSVLMTTRRPNAEDSLDWRSACPTIRSATATSMLPPLQQKPINMKAKSLV